MPFALKKVKGGWVVVNQETGEAKSNHPLPKKRALGQLAVLNAKMRSGEIK